MKKVLKMILLVIIYIALTFLPEFPGFLSPIWWFFFPVIAAFLAATPFLWGAKNWKTFGGVAIFPIVWYVMMLAFGELKFPERTIMPIVIIIVAELVRKFVGYEKQQGLRLSYAVVSLVPAMLHLIIFTRTDYYYEGAVDEMGSVAYADTITSFAKPGYLILLLALTFVVGYIGAVVAEKIFKTRVMIGTEN